MKLSELNPSKEYFIYNREHWIDAGYSRESYYEVSKAIGTYYRYQLVTDTEGNLRRYGSQVLAKRKDSDRTEWVTLKSIRAEFFDAVELLTKHNREKSARWNDRGAKYAKHLQRKAEHERRQIEKPIEEEFMKEIKTLYPHAWRETKLNHLPIEAMQTITQALKQYQSRES